MQIKLRATCALFFVLSVTACSKQGPSLNSNPIKPQIPIVRSSRVNLLDSNRPTVTPGATSSNSVQVEITVDRDALLNQEFLYGADLQYSSLIDSQLQLYTQSLALGHTVARFRIAGDELQLYTDNRLSFPSDVNHPEQLLSRYKILGQTEASPGKPATLTLSGANSKVTLSQLFQGAAGTSGNLPAPRDLWIRSFDYVPEGNYLLQQTSIILADGTIAEFMESVFPRSTLTPSASFEKFQMDPTDPVGASSGSVAKYMMLPGQPIYDGDQLLSFSQHFDIGERPNQTIDFYVTPNIPDEDLQPVQLAVEGWNRYFTHFKGIERPVMRFMGRLPAGIHIGDPRYNVINWDSRKVAGAAYESQASDPSTGKQSHSLIYMPAAWLQIGNDYWTNGQFGDVKSTSRFHWNLANESVSPAALNRYGGAFKSSRLACLRDVREGADLMNSGRVPFDDVKIFAVQLLKQTLFHEVGHSLGLAHNFKGSLAFNRSIPNSIFSTSIMDYNDFEIERTAFSAVDSWDGPQLEYDRQAINTIYNKGVDVTPDAPAELACNDAEADNEDGGVDPLCNRYDVENDPTLSVNTAYNRITKKTMPGDVTLAQALMRVQQYVLSDSALQAIKEGDDLADLMEKLVVSLEGSISFYITSGKTSLARTVALNVKSLLMFEDNILPDGYDERAMRERAFNGVKEVSSLIHMPQVIMDAMQDVTTATATALQKTPLAQGLGAEGAIALNTEVKSILGKVVPLFESNEKFGLPLLHAAVFLAIKRHPKVPFFLGKLGSSQLDYETANVGILSDAAVDRLRTRLERLAAATALVTYKGRLAGDDQVISQAVSKVNDEVNTATDNTSRETAEQVFNILKGASSS